MIKMIAATLAALYLVFLIFGDESRRPEEVARAETGPSFDFSFSDWIEPAVAPVVPRSTSDVSEAEAIEIALDAGRQHRDARKAEPLIGSLVAAVETVDAPTEVADDPLDRSMWYVTGTTVNVRSGPGTSNPVVAQVRFGDAAEVLDEDASGWVQIRPEGGATIGWISSQFMSPNAPG